MRNATAFTIATVLHLTSVTAAVVTLTTTTTAMTVLAIAILALPFVVTSTLTLARELAPRTSTNATTHNNTTSTVPNTKAA